MALSPRASFRILDGWYVAKTLLSSTPDRNQRNLYYKEYRVRSFNSEMKPWPPEATAKLDEVCRLLNEVEELLDAEKLE